MFIKARDDSRGHFIEARTQRRRRRSVENERSHLQLVNGRVHPIVRSIDKLGKLDESQ
jgi:hypothetical protein